MDLWEKTGMLKEKSTYNENDLKINLNRDQDLWIVKNACLWQGLADDNGLNCLIQIASHLKN